MIEVPSRIFAPRAELLGIQDELPINFLVHQHEIFTSRLFAYRIYNLGALDFPAVYSNLTKLYGTPSEYDFACQRVAAHPTVRKFIGPSYKSFAWSVLVRRPIEDSFFDQMALPERYGSRFYCFLHPKRDAFKSRITAIRSAFENIIDFDVDDDDQKYFDLKGPLFHLNADREHVEQLSAMV